MRPVLSPPRGGLWLMQPPSVSRLNDRRQSQVLHPTTDNTAAACIKGPRRPYMAMLRVLQPSHLPRRWGPRLQCAGWRPAIRCALAQRRAFFNLPGFLVPPVVFGGLFVGLWTWKCVMMVTFQNKIIYMPGLPPNSRWEKIDEYRNQCQGVEWREERIKSSDGTRISLCVASVTSGTAVTLSAQPVYILYFQGNASSLPPRLPFLSPIFRILKEKPTRGRPVKYTIVCCSYRGYWTSKGRPTEQGIALDAAAALQWVKNDLVSSAIGDGDDETPVVIWGQSIGAGVATSLAAQQEPFNNSQLSLKTVILETPFLSIRAMLETLYPQKWLPYRYLWPFLRNHLDSSKALGIMQERFDSNNIKPPKILILEAGRDELVPKQHGDMLEKRCQELGLEVTKTVVANAYHTEVLVRPGGISAVVEELEKVAKAEKGV